LRQALCATGFVTRVCAVIIAATFKRGKALHRELSDPFNSWLNEDVYYITLSEEKTTFFGLSTNEERDQFIEHFWYAAATCED
jgi:hypothetical protein